jgi:ADP-dependent phosphofructokinase/glucokinase
MARENDVFFFVGSHYMTQGSGLQSRAAAHDLAAQFDVMKAANPNLTVHLQYVIPKNAANEAEVMSQMRGHVSSMSLNSVEVPALLSNLHKAGWTDFTLTAPNERGGLEQPEFLLDTANALKGAMQLDRLHFHAFDGDFLVVNHCQHQERQVLALLKARQMASMKAANDSGEIRQSDEIWPVAPVVAGRGLAAVHAFADVCQKRFDLDPTEHAAIVDRWWYTDRQSGDTYFFVPSRGIHDRTGGTVSLGDTIDSTALIYGRA